MHDDELGSQLRRLLRGLPEPAPRAGFAERTIARLQREQARRRRRRGVLAAVAVTGLAMAAALTPRGAAPRPMPSATAPAAAAADGEARAALEELRRERAAIAGQIAELEALRSEAVYLGGNEKVDVVLASLSPESSGTSAEERNTP